MEEKEDVTLFSRKKNEDEEGFWSVYFLDDKQNTLFLLSISFEK